jgi:hypothetical protein
MHQLQFLDGSEIASDYLVLHKTSKVSGFHIHATDGAIGHVDDFLFDEQWNISHLVVDTSNWLGGKWVLISTAMVSHVDSPAKRIDVKLTREQIAQGPSIDTADIELVETLPPFLIF